MNFIPKRLKIFPQIEQHNWLNHAIIIDFLEKCAQEHATGILVDIGCGTKPYKSIFEPYVSEHIGVDRETPLNSNSKVDIIGDAYDLTMMDSSCDTILSTEVLEHLEDPNLAIQEMNRVLKDNGVVILTVPFFWHVHSAPRDFYRYTEYGLAYLFEKNGFKIEEIKPLTGFVVTFSQLLIYYLRRFQTRSPMRVVGDFFNYFMQHFALWANKYDRSHEFTNLYGLVARKIQ